MYKCGICGFSYKEKQWADKCYASQISKNHGTSEKALSDIRDPRIIRNVIKKANKITI